MHRRSEVLEGRQAVLAAIRAGQRRIDAVLIRRDAPAARVADVASLAAERGLTVRHAERAELEALAHGKSHGGVIALCGPKPRLSADDLMDLLARLDEPPLLLLIEGVDDARNLGFTLRSADALGAHAVLVKKHLWDLDAAEVARPASGAYERLPLVQIDSTRPLACLRKAGLRLVGCIGGARRRLFELDLRGPTMLAIGGEKRGLSGATRGVCDVFATIPTRRGAPSLALSHAAAIALAEAHRQRLGGASPSAEAE